MRVLISTYGSRGDVQPMLALGVALRKLGVEARMRARCGGRNNLEAQ
jgi:vancomycin aglycone glucosyltransferase